MNLRLTPAMLEATYELLRLTKPFKQWKLPHADDVEFHVTRHADRRGDCVDAGHAHVIRISETQHDTLVDLIETMAHEMVHLRLDIIRPKDKATHGVWFKRLAKQVCRHQGFEEATF
jgi:hypothetical protein